MGKYNLELCFRVCERMCLSIVWLKPWPGCFPASVKLYWHILNYAVWKNAALIYDFKEVSIMKLNYFFLKIMWIIFQRPCNTFPKENKKIEIILKETIK